MGNRTHSGSWVKGAADAPWDWETSAERRLLNAARSLKREADYVYQDAAMALGPEEPYRIDGETAAVVGKSIASLRRKLDEMEAALAGFGRAASLGRRGQENLSDWAAVKASDVSRMMEDVHARRDGMDGPGREMLDYAHKGLNLAASQLVRLAEWSEEYGIGRVE